VLALAPENLAALRGLIDSQDTDSADETAPAARESWASAIELSQPGGAAMRPSAIAQKPALGGLEAFLGAIGRARTGRIHYG
jgi:hypothetical protein